MNKLEKGRSLLEVVAVLAVVGLLGILGILFFQDTVNQHEADRVYEDIALVASSALNKGTTRTNKGMADTMLGAYSSEGVTTRSGHAFSVNIQEDTLTISVTDIDKDVCDYLMRKKWRQLLAFLSVQFGGQNVAMGSDCSGDNFPSKGLFSVIFKANGTIQRGNDQAQTNGTGGGAGSGSGGSGNGTGGASGNEEQGNTGSNEGGTGAGEQSGSGEGTSSGNEGSGTGEGESGNGEQTEPECRAHSDCNAANACMICNSNTQTCENGCTPLAYLESNGTQYIDTEIAGDSNNFLIEFKFNLLSYTRYGGLFGNYINETTNTWRILQQASNTTSMWVYANSRANSAAATITNITKNTDHTISYNRSSVVVDGTSYSLNNASGTSNNTSIALFSQKVGANGSNMKLYYFKIKDNGTLVRDFVPVRAEFKTDGKQNCMFDQVSKGLFCNVASGDFIAGTN